MAKLVLIDRDGTINVERHYLSDPEQIELFPQTAEGLRILKTLGFRIAVVTNQSAIGRGIFDIERLGEIHSRLTEVLHKENADVDAIYFCPHVPEDDCLCRKPKVQMAAAASTELEGELSKSFVIGDNVCDIELGENIGATTILVKTGYGKRVLEEKTAAPDHIVENLFEAAVLIRELVTER